jgi:putative oxidoreductase
MDMLPAIGQVLIGFYYVFFGFWNIYHWSPMTQVMLQRKLPAPLFLLSLVIGLQIIAGVMIMFSIFVKATALLLIPFTLVVVFLLHPFWNFTGELRKQHMALWVTNLTMCLGALLQLTQ